MKKAKQQHPCHLPKFASQDARECHVHAAFLWICLITFFQHILELVAPMPMQGISLFAAAESSTMTFENVGVLGLGFRVVLTCNEFEVKPFASSSAAARAEVQGEKLAKRAGI